MNEQRKLKLRLSDAKALSKQLEDAMTDIKDEIVSCVAQQPQKGRLVNDSPRVFTLKLAELENGVLSAEYYDVNAQSRAVKKNAVIRADARRHREARGKYVQQKIRHHEQPNQNAPK